MKMQKELYAKLADAIDRAMNDRLSGYTMEYWVDEYEKTGATSQRLRWDLLHCAVNSGSISYQELYSSGLKDSHIDTALRQITGTK